MESKTVLHLQQNDFEKEVLQSSVPVVIDFYADWCGPCRMVSPVLEGLSKEYTGKVKFVKVDTDANQELAMRYNIMSIPTVMVILGGKVKDTIIGAAPSSHYRQRIDQAISRN